MKFLINHFYLFLAISFGTASQLIIKWKMAAFSFDDYETWQDKFIFAFSMLLNPYIIIALVLTLLAGVTWMIAMTKFELSYAYPFTTLAFVVILIFSVIFLDETLSLYKIIGTFLILSGILIISKGM